LIGAAPCGVAPDRDEEYRADRDAAALANLWLARKRLLPLLVRYARETGNAGKSPGISRPTVKIRLFFIGLMTVCAKMAGYSDNP